MSSPRVVLVSMPYDAIERPSIALGLLQACLLREGIPTRTVHANLLFADRVGLARYAVMEVARSVDLLGEWTFSAAAFPGFESDPDAYFAAIGLPSPRVERAARELREEAVVFVDELARELVASGPAIVGCTSTFQQNCASLALLRRVKELAPATVTVMGGANCEGVMGLTLRRSFPWVDYVVSGEADELVGPFFRSLLDARDGGGPAELPAGVFGAAQARRRGLSVVGAEPPAPRAVAQDLDAIPIPRYDDYFTTLRGTAFGAGVHPGLLVETSRGCWWGQKHHCTFCGLNGQGLGYRAKSPARVTAELDALAERYGIPRFEVVDNILSMDYLDTVLAGLARRGAPYRFFYEIKANLRRSQLRRLADAGVTWVQPGIEGLHDGFLKLIDKGTTALMNVQMLKWARQMGVWVSWNVLVHAPGEQDAWYREMAGWLPWVAHLQPPMSLVRIRFDRFSPYFARAAEHGIELAPFESYGFVYPLAPRELMDLAYFFRDRLQGQAGREWDEAGRDARPGLEAVKDQVLEWRSSFNQVIPPVLAMWDDGQRVRIADSRPCAVLGTHYLEGLDRRVYLACDAVASPSTIAAALGRDGGEPAASADVDAALARLRDARLVLEDHGRWLALAVEAPIPPLPTHAEFPGGHYELPESLRTEMARLGKEEEHRPEEALAGV